MIYIIAKMKHNFLLTTEVLYTFDFFYRRFFREYTVAVVGIGGVGSVTAEMLTRYI